MFACGQRQNWYEPVQPPTEKKETQEESEVGKRRGSDPGTPIRGRPGCVARERREAGSGGRPKSRFGMGSRGSDLGESWPGQWCCVAVALYPLSSTTLLAYLPTYLPIYLLAYILAYLPIYPDGTYQFRYIATTITTDDYELRNVNEQLLTTN